jgi:hypothetical protein
MPKYLVGVNVTYFRSVEVEAKNEDEAMRIVRLMDDVDIHHNSQSFYKLPEEFDVWGIIRETKDA